ncbi:MAG: stress response protein [Pseudomonadota bacterium]
MELKQKGASANLGSFKQLKVSLIWTSAVDLDLMAFYKTKDGRVGGVYSDNYAGGSMGDLNAFPWAQLSGDAGVGAKGGDNEEVLLVSKLDDFEELFICALNFTDASAGTNKVFADYDARVEVVTDRGEKHVIKLDSRQQGSVAVIAKFSAGFLGAQILNDSSVLTFDQFKSTVPGAGALQLASKVTLAQKGDSIAIKPKVSGGAHGNEVLINLNWNTGAPKKKGFLSSLMGGGGEQIDLDLGVFFEMWEGPKSCIQPLGRKNPDGTFGSFNYPPWILHLGDDRSGAWSEGENIKINLAQWQQLKRVLIYTYIYEGAPRWDVTDAVVTVKAPGSPVIEVRMGDQKDARRLCAIAMLENVDGQIKVTKEVRFFGDQEECDHHYGWGMRWTVGSKD